MAAYGENLMAAVKRLWRRGELVQFQRDPQLGRTWVQRSTKLFFDRAQPTFDGLTDHPQRGSRRGNTALGVEICAQCRSQHQPAITGVVKW